MYTAKSIVINHPVCTFTYVKSFNIYELDYKRIHFVASAERFQRGSAHTRFWLAVILSRLVAGVVSRVVRTGKGLFKSIVPETHILTFFVI